MVRLVGCEFVFRTIIYVLLVSPVDLAHFAGGIFMWAPTGNGNEIKVDFRLSWERQRHFCDAATVTRGSLIGEGSLGCFSGCSISQSLQVYCTDFSETDSWSSGRNNFTFTPSANQSSFGFTGGDWISLVAGGSSWSLKTTADLSYRSDTNRINSSPTVEMSPIVTLQHGCQHKIILPVYDADGDNIRCRYAAGAEECAGVCNVFPAILDSTGCTLQYTANGAIGWYAVAVQIEDFLSASSTTPLSSVSLQFLVKVFSATGSCGSAPVFVSPTPATETCFPISANERFTFTVVAFTNSAASIKSIDTVKNGPSTTSSQFSNSTGKYMRLEATWTPTLSYAGSQAMCFTAVDYNGLRSEMRCVHLYVEAKPNLEEVRKTESGSFLELELIYDKGLERPRNSKYIYIYEANDKLHSTLDSTTANVTFGSSNIRFGMDVDLSTSYYILLDEGVVLGGCKQPAVAITNKTRIVIKRKECPEPQRVSHGTWKVNSTVYGNNASLTCDQGYQLSGDVTLVCGANETWQGRQPICTIIDCGELADVKNGSVMYNGTTYGNMATYRCDTGFDISNGSLITRECTENGTWSVETPHCIIKDCGDLPGVVNGSVSYRNTTYGETATYTCDTGFDISNASLITRKCNKDGNWTGMTPHCIIKDCGKLDAIRNGSVTYHSTTYGETATYRCDTGFDISNASLITRECAEDGSWTAEPPHCNIKDCGELADMKNGSVMYNGITYGDVATYRCNMGFEINNGSLITRECTENGTWSGETPHCIIKDCGDLPGLVNGSVTYHNTTYGETATYTCDTGFDISNASLFTRKCNKDGNWTGMPPHCIIKDCGELDALSNGSVTYNGTTYGEKATYKCNTGFDISNDSLITRECGHDGFWSGKKPHCIIKDCGMLPDLKNGSVIYKETTYGEKATYTCDTGFDISDERLNTRKCTENGTWSEKAPHCIIKVCNTPVNVEFASVTYKETNYMESATYMCNDNYFLSAGNDIRRCEADAHWSGNAPTCTGKFRPGEECLADLTGVSQCLGKEFSCRFDTATGKFRCLCSPELIFSVTQEKAVCLEKSGYGGKCQIGKQCTPFLSECIRIGHDPGTCGCPSGTKYNETADECSTHVILFCPAGTDQLGLLWNKTRILTTAYQQCPVGSSGQIIRPCLVGGTFSSALYNCTKEVFKNLTTKIQSSNMTTTKALETLQEALSDIKNNSAEIHAGDVDGIETVLTQIVEMEVNETTSVEQLKTNAQTFFDIADMLTDPETSGPVWESKVEQTNKGAEKFIETIDRYSLNLATTLASSNETKMTIENKNLVVSVSKVSEDQNTDLKYPHKGELPPFKTNRTSSFTLKSESFSGQTDKITSVVVVVYRNISTALPKTNAQQTSQSTARTINSQVLSIQLLPKPPKVLNPPIQLTFSIDEHKEGFESHCSFWEPSKDGTTGGWSTSGCERTMANATTVQCSCSHLTNFAILTSPIATPLEHQTALTAISLTGCVVSIVCLVVTLVLHVTYWRFLKGDRNVLAMTVCASLLVAYLLFVFGVTRTTVKGVCTFIAVLLHYSFLLVFFLLLAEAMYMALQVVLPFHKKTHLKELLIGAFAIPGVFVLVVASATDLHGYGNDKYCWLTVDSLAFWMFVGPVALVIVFNLVIIILIMKKMYGTKWIQDMSQREQAKTLASKTLVMLPVMGVTWLFGILSVHESAIWLQYLFVLFNSFQGLFIFIFHCVLNKQLRAAISKSRQQFTTISESSSSRSRGTTEHSSNYTTVTNVEPPSTVTYDTKTDLVTTASTSPQTHPDPSSTPTPTPICRPIIEDDPPAIVSEEEKQQFKKRHAIPSQTQIGESKPRRPPTQVFIDLQLELRGRLRNMTNAATARISKMVESAQQNTVVFSRKVSQHSLQKQPQDDQEQIISNEGEEASDDDQDLVFSGVSESKTEAHEMVSIDREDASKEERKDGTEDCAEHSKGSTEESKEERKEDLEETKENQTDGKTDSKEQEDKQNDVQQFAAKRNSKASVVKMNMTVNVNGIEDMVTNDKEAEGTFGETVNIDDFKLEAERNMS